MNGVLGSCKPPEVGAWNLAPRPSAWEAKCSYPKSCSYHHFTHYIFWTNLLQWEIYFQMILLSCHWGWDLSLNSQEIWIAVLFRIYMQTIWVRDNKNSSHTLTIGYLGKTFCLIFSCVRLWSYHFKILQAMDHLPHLCGDYFAIKHSSPAMSKSKFTGFESE